MKTAIFITGTICSGKSTLSEKISKALNIDMISENNSNGFFGIIDRVRNNDFTSPVIIEHTDILNVFNGEISHDISGYFDKKILILINVSDDILTKNINDRKARGVTGDYLKVDMFAMKKDIENKFNKTKNDFIRYVANIDTVDDYDNEYKKIIAFLSEHLRSE
jgi:thymidylate kinase